MQVKATMQNALEPQHCDSASEDEELEFFALVGGNAPLNRCYHVTGVVSKKRICNDSAQTAKEWIDKLKAGIMIEC